MITASVHFISDEFEKIWENTFVNSLVYFPFQILILEKSMKRFREHVGIYFHRTYWYLYQVNLDNNNPTETF